jgi:hypothetical protein
MSNPDYQEVLTGTLGRAFNGVIPEEIVRHFEGTLAVYYVQDRHITVAAVVSDLGTLLGAGASKRNPEDRPNALRGKALALTRAIRAAIVVSGLSMSAKDS